jgi:hypothetical protein
MNAFRFFPPNAYAFKGGAGAMPSTTYVQQQAPAPTLQTPTPPAPPATTSSMEVNQARLDARRQAGAKKGLQSTILAGATGGQSESRNGLATTSTGKATLLGGG